MVLAAAPTQDESAIKAVFDGRHAAWEHKDAVALASYFEDDGDFVSSRGERVSGKSNLVKSYEKTLAAPEYRNTDFTYEITSLRFPRPDVAVVDADWVVTGLQNQDGIKQPELKLTAVVVLTKTGESWKISSMRMFKSRSN